MKKVILVIIVFVFFSCKKNETSATVNNEALTAIDTVKVIKFPKLNNLSANVRTEANKWPQFLKFEEAIFRLQSNKGDLLTEVENILKLEKELTESKFPEKFDHPAIKSRLLVIKTFLEQLKASATGNFPDSRIRSQKIRVVEGYNSLLLQFSEAMEKKVTEEFLIDE
ncbi:hypothetical protein [Abyssalbus ytuae]|uniref:Lipoprotein n=1 Tax=Abyssalbus ytuae TaxID=2926907 RepID=A0A9E6ZSW2_9FLAO|nr:hypothetical protein [Abyssalbus ytuae]UOB16081.1 hypothetical protein MQE35_10060 [Abyssalbus ytuae]